MSKNVRSIDIDSALVPTAGVNANIINTAGSVQTLAALNANTQKIIWTVEGGNIHMTFDDSDPSAAAGSGHLLANGASGTWGKPAATAAKFFLDAGAVFYATEMTY